MYSFDSRVRYSECDENGRLSLVSMIDYLQDCSTFQCEDLGEGVLKLKEEGLGWILANWRIEIHRLPVFGEKIRTFTWCYEMKSLHARRCFEIHDENGESLVVADSQWFIFDLNNRKVARVPQTQQFYLEDTPRAEMGKMERKLTGNGEAAQTTPIAVTEQHLDTNQHVNNAQYVMMAIAALHELGATAALDALSVQYRNMARLGDTVVPHVYPCEGGHTVELKGADDVLYATVRFQGK